MALGPRGLGFVWSSIRLYGFRVHSGFIVLLARGLGSQGLFTMVSSGCGL